MDLPAHEARQIAVLRAYMEHGRVDEAAKSLGITRNSAMNLLARLRRRYGVEDNTIAVLGPMQEAGLVTIHWNV